jgi:CheY-like chemotaxis protein
MATILVVDDHAISREFLVTLLGYVGYQLLEAGRAEEALDVTCTMQPDLVIADVLMPTIDGFEFVRRLRADPTIAQTRVIFYTATYMEAEVRALAEACGVKHVLVKPTEPQNGSIEVISEWQRGSTFVIHLPSLYNEKVQLAP